MCMMNGKPVSEYNSPCGHCHDYLCTCNPIVMISFIVCWFCFMAQRTGNALIMTECIGVLAF